MAMSHVQAVVLAIMPKVSGLFSFALSMIIVWTVLRDPTRRSKTFHRLVCAISVLDCIASIIFFSSTWPMPSEHSNVFAIGSATLCTIAGAIKQFAVTSSILYSAALSIYFLLAIRCNWTKSALEKAEVALHGVPILYGLASTIAGLVRQVYGNAFLWCWVTPEHDIFRFWLGFLPIWIGIVTVTVCSAIIFHQVWLQGKRNQRYNFAQNSTAEKSSEHQQRTQASNIDGDEESAVRGGSVRTRCSCWKSQPQREQPSCPKNPRNLTKETAIQCFWFAGAFYLTISGLTALRILEKTSGGAPYPLVVLTSIVTPMFGVPNFVVYFLPKYRQFRHDHPEVGLITALRFVLFTDTIPQPNSDSATSASSDRPGIK